MLPLLAVNLPNGYTVKCLLKAIDTMPASATIPVRCQGCGRLYHVPPSAVDQRAKCRRCGHEFVIRATPDDPLGNGRTPPAARRAIAERMIASRLAVVCSRRPSRNWNLRRLVAPAGFLVVAAGLLTAVVVGALSSRKVHDNTTGNLQRGRVARLSAPRSELEFRSVAELVEAIEPSVVQIETDLGTSSGFVLDESGMIVTCHHCIDGARKAVVIFANNSRVPVIGVCRIASDRDLAIILVETSKPLVPLPVAIQSPKKGDPIVAFGSPAGLSFTISEGSVSSLRSGQELINLHGEFDGSLRGDTYFDLSPKVSLVQITASMMPGNSGGPVVDFFGNVIGISSFVLNWQGQMYEFCISSEEIRRLAANVDHQVTPL